MRKTALRTMTRFFHSWTQLGEIAMVRKRVCSLSTLLVLLVSRLLGLAGPIVPARAAPLLQGELSCTQLDPLPVSENTGEMPQSKVWTHGGEWWSVLPSSSASSSGTWLWRLEGSTWTEALQLSTETGTKADVKSAGDVSHILLYDSSPELVSVEYVGGDYQLWSTRPVSVPIPLPDSEIASIDIDSAGRMWLATESGSDIVVHYSDSPYSTWIGPEIIGSGVTSGDVSVVTAMPGNMIGVLWSNQNDGYFHFRTHADGAGPGVWSTVEDISAGSEAADDHANVAAASDGTLYAAVKTQATAGDVNLLVRRPGGTWDSIYQVDVVGSRPIVVLSEDEEVLRVIYTSASGGGSIIYKETPLSLLDFSASPSTLMNGSSMDNASSTKQSYSDELVVIASDDSSAQGIFCALPPHSGLVAHYEMEENGGTVLVDSSSEGNSGTLAGDPSWVTSQAGMGLTLDLDGAGDYALVPDNASLDGEHEITLALWVRPGRQSAQSLIQKAVNGGVDGYELSLADSGRAYVRLNQASSGDAFRLDSTSSYPSDGSTWVHLAATYDGSVIKLYFNGVQEGGDRSGPTSIYSNTLSLTIGAQSDGATAFPGQIDDVRVLNQALSAEEIAGLACVGHLSTWYADSDGDGYGDPAVSATICEQPVGFVADATDCDDGDPYNFPGNGEVCDGQDNDCDTLVDDADPDCTGLTPFYHDADGDGYTNNTDIQDACSDPDGPGTAWVDAPTANDCDDSDGAINPGAAETCNGIDDDCDGLADSGDLSVAATVSGQGFVNNTPGNPYQCNETATLEPVADAGWTFVGWSGLDAGTLSDNQDGTWFITMDGDKAVVATFIPVAYSTTVQVSASSDDAEEWAGGGMYVISSDLELVYDYGDQTVGLRFVGVNTPQGATILNATIQFQVDEVSTNATSLTVEGHSADAAPPFSGSDWDISSRARTLASTVWNPAPWPTVGQAGPDQRTPDIGGVVQEIVNRPGWAEGNALVVIFTGTGERVAESYDGSASSAPLLSVEYAAGPRVNRPPAVDAGADQAIILPNSAFLAGTVADDGLPDPPATITTLWTQVGGTGAATFTDPSAVDAAVTFPTEGVYVLRLEADDGELTASDEVSITAEMAPPPGLVVYPYLGDTTPTSVVISWATDGPGNSEVRYSLDQSYASTVAAASNVYDGKHWHSATAMGLTAGTTYFYRVFTGGEDVTPWMEVTFTTGPAPTATGFSFAALGDSRPPGSSMPPNQSAFDVAAQMAQRSFGLAIHTGDIVYSGGTCSGDNSSWNQYIRAYFDLYQDILGHAPAYPALGNHELHLGTCGYQAYSDVFELPRNAPAGDEEKYYSFDWANAHFVALDTNLDYNTGSVQHEWLLSDLESTTLPWILVFFHHPAYNSGEHGSTSRILDHLVPVFEAHGVDVVFSGHEHSYERTCPIMNGACSTPEDGGVVYIVTGGGGAPLDDVPGDWFTAYGGDGIHHFIEANVDDCLLRLDAVDTSGNVFDSYEIDHCATSPTNRPPSVYAGTDQAITLSGTAFLDGTISDDGLPDPPGATTSTWSQVSGPGTVSFADSSAIDTTATFSEEGAYVLRLTADDGELSASDEAVVAVGEHAQTVTVEMQVGSGTDDAEERFGGEMYIASSDLELVYDYGYQTVGLRFVGMDIPRDATILSATIQFQVDEVSTDSASLTIQGQAADDAPAFSAADRDISSRARTPASVGWNPAPWPGVAQAGPDQRTPNIASVIQDVVNRPGWSQGNALVLIITGTGERVAESYDGNPNAAPLLQVQYSTAPPVNQPPVVDAGTDQTIVLPQSASLDATVSDDGLPDPPGVVGTLWTQLSGPGTANFTDVSAVDTSALFSAEGTYVLELSGDDGELQTSDTVTITVNPEPPNQPPTVDAGLDQTIALCQSVVLNGSVYDDGMPVPPGIVTSTWSQVSGPGSVSFGDSSAVDTTAAFSDSGSFVLQLRADDSALTTSDAVTVTVEPGCTIETFQVRVASGTDDVEERAGGEMYIASSDLELVYDYGYQTVGLRFVGMDIPRDATILSATIQFQVDEVSIGSASLTIQGQAADDAPAFSAADWDISSRARTPASVGWNPAPWPGVAQAGPDQRTPNIASVIQDVVNRPGWSQGNALVLIITGTGERVAESYDGIPNAAPLLTVEYSAGGTP